MVTTKLAKMLKKRIPKIPTLSGVVAPIAKNIATEMLKKRIPKIPTLSGVVAPIAKNIATDILTRPVEPSQTQMGIPQKGQVLPQKEPISSILTEAAKIQLQSKREAGSKNWSVSIGGKNYSLTQAQQELLQPWVSSADITDPVVKEIKEKIERGKAAQKLIEEQTPDLARQKLLEEIQQTKWQEKGVEQIGQVGPVPEPGSLTSATGAAITALPTAAVAKVLLGGAKLASPYGTLLLASGAAISKYSLSGKRTINTEDQRWRDASNIIDNLIAAQERGETFQYTLKNGTVTTDPVDIFNENYMDILTAESYLKKASENEILSIFVSGVGADLVEVRTWRKEEENKRANLIAAMTRPIPVARTETE